MIAVRMGFCLLGPLTVRVDGVVVPIPRGKQRALLAALLLHAGRTVTTDQLADLLWGPALPLSAAVTLQNYVKRLRQALGAGRDRIMTEPGGYLIQVHSGELDISAMGEALTAAHRAAQAGAWLDASVQAAAALAFWRGEALCDVDLGVLALTELPRLTEMRLQARELAIEAGLHLGGHPELVAEAMQLTVAAPLREHLHALLMQALYRSGRRAEALEAYQHARGVLVRELGSEPGPELQALHRQILDDDPALAASRSPALSEAATAGGTQDRLVPRELPAAVPSFTGRDSELAALASLIRSTSRSAPPAMLITAIGGTAGVGKTALAVQWAHQVTGRFPDGQLYVNLRGYDPAQPKPAADALAGFLRALGVPSHDIPLDEGERAARYRSLLAGQRILVLIDNAADADQVRPLLPGTPGCMAVVTSRDSLAGLVARDGAQRLDLDLLPLADAVRLLRILIGARVDADPEAAAALAACCCRLPLALRVAAELAASRPGASLARLAGDLADQQQRLDLLDAGGDVRAAVRAVFSWSYRHLDPASAQVFRLVGDHPGTSVDAPAVAAQAGLTPQRAGQLLHVLCRAYLMQPAGPGRYGMHDLLRAYARELAATDDTPAVRGSAMTRLIDYYLNGAGSAVSTLYPATQRRSPAVQSAGTDAPSVADPAAARAWLDAELPNLLAVAAHAAAHGQSGHVARLATSLFRYLDTGGHYAEAMTIHAHARHAASQARDCSAEAEALINLAIAEARQCSHQAATGHLQEALARYREAGNKAGEARALGNLGVACLRQGRYQEAAAYLQQALPMFRESGHRTREASAMDSLGLACLRQGRYQDAATYLQEALDLSREIGSRSSEARALTNLGDVDLRQSRYEQATSNLQQSLAICRETGDRVGEAYALASFGDLDLRQGHWLRSVSYHQRALSLFREISDRSGEADALNGLGAALLASGQAIQARMHYAAAVTLAGQTGDIYQQARGHDGLGNVHHATGNPGQARRHWDQALTLYSGIGDPEADRVRARLAMQAEAM